MHLLAPREMHDAVRRGPDSTHVQRHSGVVHRIPDQRPPLPVNMGVLFPKHHGHLALVAQVTLSYPSERIVRLALAKGGGVDVCCEIAEGGEDAGIKGTLRVCQPKVLRRQDAEKSAPSEPSGRQDTCL